MMFAPLEGWRHVKVTDRHTALDYARVLKDLADIHFAHAKTIVLVQDNLSIHSKASLYEAFPAVEARRLVERFEWHYTPKHGSWLDLAESELGVLTSQCLNRRIPNKQILVDEIAAWEHDRNANHTKADWQFTTKNARIKLKNLYPATRAAGGVYQFLNGSFGKWIQPPSRLLAICENVSSEIFCNRWIGRSGSRRFAPSMRGDPSRA